MVINHLLTGMILQVVTHRTFSRLVCLDFDGVTGQPRWWWSKTKVFTAILPKIEVVTVQVCNEKKT